MRGGWGGKFEEGEERRGRIDGAGGATVMSTEMCKIYIKFYIILYVTHPCEHRGAEEEEQGADRADARVEGRQTLVQRLNAIDQTDLR